MNTDSGAFLDPLAPLDPAISKAEAFRQDPIYTALLVELVNSELAVEHNATARAEAAADAVDRLRQDYAALYEHTEPRMITLVACPWRSAFGS